MKIRINKYYVKKCKDFAKERMEGSSGLYKHRGEKNMIKMEQDIFIGTLAEWGAYRYLTDKGVAVSKPDMKIYTTRRKSFSADLLNDDFRFHIKSQSKVSADRYGMSWLLQKTDRILDRPEPDEHFIFTRVDGDEVEIMGVVKVLDIVEEGLIGEPKIPRYRYSKKALYFDDIAKSELELWRV